MITLCVVWMIHHQCSQFYYAHFTRPTNHTENLQNRFLCNVLVEMLLFICLSSNVQYMSSWFIALASQPLMEAGDIVLVAFHRGAHLTHLSGEMIWHNIATACHSMQLPGSGNGSKTAGILLLRLSRRYEHMLILHVTKIEQVSRDETWDIIVKEGPLPVLDRPAARGTPEVVQNHLFKFNRLPPPLVHLIDGPFLVGVRGVQHALDGLTQFVIALGKRDRRCTIVRGEMLA